MDGRAGVAVKPGGIQLPLCLRCLSVSNKKKRFYHHFSHNNDLCGVFHPRQNDCCHDYLIHRFTPDHRGGFKLYCFLLFSVMVHRKALRSRTKDYMKLEVI